MAVNIRQLFPLQQAKARRGQLPRYLRLDGGRYLIGAALILSLLSLISLGQTGRLATQGYEIAQLQQDKTNLLRERSVLQLELSEAQSLAKIEQRARELKLRPMTPDQAVYITIGTLPEQQPRAEQQELPAENRKP
jgi:cell division protein FtsL